MIKRFIFPHKTRRVRVANPASDLELLAEFFEEKFESDLELLAEDVLNYSNKEEQFLMKHRVFFICLLVVLGFRLYAYYVHAPNYIDGTKIQINSRISSEPIRYENAQYFRLDGLKIYLPLYPEVSYGDKVVIEGVVGSDAKGKVDRMKNPILISLTENTTPLYSLRKNILEFLRKSLPEPHSSLIAGMVLGSKKNLPKDFYQDLQSTGTIHVVVASGMNATLVGGFVLSTLLHMMRRNKAVFLSVSVIWMYAVLSGFDAPIIRASVMTTIASIGQFSGRLHLSWWSLGMTMFLMLCVKPEWLGDLGFVLSFVSTTSLMLFEKRIAPYFCKVPTILREGLTTSLAAQVGVGPILFLTFGQFNIFSPVINAFILWTVPFITVIGFIAGSIGLIWYDLGKVILYVAYPFTSWFIWIVRVFS